jgi:hypothetical protein
MSKRKFIYLAVLALIVVGCGSTSEDAGAPDGGSASVATTADSTGTTAETPDTTTDDQPPKNSGGSDGSGIDWASVDLTTIDWGSIDLRTIDWKDIEENPSAESIDQAARDLIQSRLNPGSGTLTIGDTTYDLQNILCAFGTEATESELYTFSLSYIGPIEETNGQLSIDIADDSGQGRLEGEGTVASLEVDDIADFENPSIQFDARDGAITLDGHDVTFEGVANDGLTDGETESIPVSFSGTCADQSLDRR